MIEWQSFNIYGVLILLTVFPKWIIYLRLKLSNIPLIFYHLYNSFFPFFFEQICHQFILGVNWESFKVRESLNVCVCMGGVWINYICIYARYFCHSCKHSLLPFSVLENSSVYLYRYSCTILIQVKSEVEWHSSGFCLNFILMFLL